ncbi:MAG TPA: RsmE family RNA methyltransferase [Candidatus Paceibacterota bacterium]
MKIHRFYTEENLRGRKEVESQKLLNQMKNVLRLEVGEEVTLFDNSGFDFLSKIKEYKKDFVVLEILKENKNTVFLEKEIYLFASLVKKDKYEWIVEKATELGVSHIVPIISDRSEKKNVNKERLNKIIIEAGEQCGRAVLPILYEPIHIKEAVKKYSNIKSIVWEPKAPRYSKNELEIIKKEVKTLGMYIGPEGGYTNDELKIFEDNNILMYSLCSQTLKTETAVISALTLLAF